MAKKNGPPFLELDLEFLVTAQRCNAEAMIQMTRLTRDGIQHAWQRQLNFIEQAIDGFAALSGAFANTNGLDNDRLAKHSEYLREAIEKNLASARELTELTAKTANTAMSVISQRVCACLDELSPARGKRNGTP